MAGRKNTWLRHRCSVPGCRKDTRADLILSERKQAPDGSYPPSSRHTINHIYLCSEHCEELQEFLETYEGGPVC